MYRYSGYRNTNIPQPPPPPIPNSPAQKPPTPKPHSTPKPKSKPPTKKKKKFDFASFKKDTCSSLNDVEHFLCDFNSFLKYIKLYNLLKK